MAHEIALREMPFDDMWRLATSVAKSRLFGIQTPDQALVLMAIAQAEGQHPAIAARDYDIIQGRPAKKAEAMLRDFLAHGGNVQWHALTDVEAEATFSHAQGGTARIRWDLERAKVAGLAGKEMYKKFPRQMLRSRVVSEGVRTVFPAATSGMYVPEEVREFTPRDPIDVTPPRSVGADLDAFAASSPAREPPPAGKETPKPDAARQRPPESPAATLDEVFIATAEDAARRGMATYEMWFKSLSKNNRQAIAPHHERLKEMAAAADAEADRDTGTEFVDEDNFPGMTDRAAPAPG